MEGVPRHNNHGTFVDSAGRYLPDHLHRLNLSGGCGRFKAAAIRAFNRSVTDQRRVVAGAARWRILEHALGDQPDAHVVQALHIAQGLD
ncbi:hypothetical protein D3C78_1817360 [compost metagenome]